MRKAIKRATKQSADKAMKKHIAEMKKKGWKVDQEFGGNAGLKYEMVTTFYKPAAKKKK